MHTKITAALYNVALALSQRNVVGASLWQAAVLYEVGRHVQEVKRVVRSENLQGSVLMGWYPLAHVPHFEEKDGASSVHYDGGEFVCRLMDVIGECTRMAHASTGGGDRTHTFLGASGIGTVDSVSSAWFDSEPSCAEIHIFATRAEAELRRNSGAIHAAKRCRDAAVRLETPDPCELELPADSNSECDIPGLFMVKLSRRLPFLSSLHLK